jgi:hypothetical protein
LWSFSWKLLDRKIVYFLTLLDTNDAIVAPLQNILTVTYVPRVSENALQCLYWSGRIGSLMEETIDDPDRLRAALAARIPPKAQLDGAQLQGFLLEYATLEDVSLRRASLQGSNLNHCIVTGTLYNARLEDASAIDAVFQNCDLSGALVSQGSAMAAILDAFHRRRYDDLAAFEKGRARERGRYAVQLFSHAGRLGHYGVQFLEERAIADLVPGPWLAAKSITADGFTFQFSSESPISDLAFAPSGNTLVCAHFDGHLSVRDGKHGKLLRVVGLPIFYDFPVVGRNLVAISPNEEWMVSAGPDSCLRSWVLPFGDMRWVRKRITARIDSLAVSPGSELIAIGDAQSNLLFWHASEGRLIHRTNASCGGIRTLAFSRSGSRLFLGSADGRILEWSVARRQWGRQVYVKGGSINAIGLCGGGSFIAIGCADGRLRISLSSNLNTASTWYASPSAGAVRALAPLDGVTVACMTDRGRLEIANALTGERSVSADFAESNVSALACSPDGSQVAAAIDTDVTVWDASSGKPIWGPRKEILESDDARRKRLAKGAKQKLAGQAAYLSGLPVLPPSLPESRTGNLFPQASPLRPTAQPEPQPAPAGSRFPPRRWR